MLTHFIPVEGHRRTTLTAVCGEQFHASQFVQVHRVAPTCPTCRAFVDDDGSDVTLRTAEESAAANREAEQRTTLIASRIRALREADKAAGLSPRPFGELYDIAARTVLVVPQPGDERYEQHVRRG